jgi:hypothetical protein
MNTLTRIENRMNKQAEWAEWTWTGIKAFNTISGFISYADKIYSFVYGEQPLFGYSPNWFLDPIQQ